MKHLIHPWTASTMCVTESCLWYNSTFYLGLLGLLFRGHPILRWIDLITSMQDTAQHTHLPPLGDKRLTFQHFSNLSYTIEMIAPYNSDARVSNSDEWPLPLLFDVAYGCTALKTWGVPAFFFFEFAKIETQNILYVSHDENNDDDDDGSDGKHRQQNHEKQAIQRCKTSGA